jgi:hypothetical protein
MFLTDFVNSFTNMIATLFVFFVVSLSSVVKCSISNRDISSSQSRVFEV